MKINEDRPVIESSGEMEEQFFSIQDTGMIFDILRNKMYGNPILAICREISCNARDAHREVGKAATPCQITVPNYLEPHYRVKDFGPGISPDRMSNIFIKYTASTKRGDNVQTGGFGLGAKTPFSYSDSFTINTVVDGIKYSYEGFIDETKVGKLSMMNKAPTDEPNGTEIVIPVKPADYSAFATGTEFVTRHWDVKPIIKGGSVHYESITPSLTGNGWAICKGGRDHNYNREMKLIIDGIEYPIDYNAIKGFADVKALDATQGKTYLYFNVGELSLSANREAVHLDLPTKAKIKARIDELSTEIVASVQIKIDAAKTLWEANTIFNTEITKSLSNINFLGAVKWEGCALTIGNSLHLNAAVTYFKKGKFSRGVNHPDKFSKASHRYLSFEDNTALFINDLGIKDPGVKNISKAYENDLALKSVQVINADDATKLDDLIKKHNLDKLGLRKLSEITKAPKNYTVSGVRLLVFKFDTVTRRFAQVSIASMEEDTNTRVIARLERDSYNNVRKALFTNKGALNNNIIASVMKLYPAHSLYGVDDTIPDDKVKENFEDFIALDKFVDEKVVKGKNIDYTKIKYAKSIQYHLSSKDLKNAEEIKKLIKDQTSVYYKYIDMSEKLLQVANNELGLLTTYESVVGPISSKDVEAFIVKNPDLDFNKIQGEMKKKYPLLAHIDHYSYRIIDPVANYINLVDKESSSKV